MTEIYLVLEGEGFLELDGERVPVKPLSAALIHPGCRHRAVGQMRIVNVPIPAFDPADEWFDRAPPAITDELPALTRFKRVFRVYCALKRDGWTRAARDWRMRLACAV